MSNYSRLLYVQRLSLIFQNLHGEERHLEEEYGSYDRDDERVYWKESTTRHDGSGRSTKHEPGIAVLLIQHTERSQTFPLMLMVASAPVEAFLLPKVDPRLHYAKDEMTKTGKLGRETDWEVCRGCQEITDQKRKLEPQNLFSVVPTMTAHKHRATCGLLDEKMLRTGKSKGETDWEVQQY